MTVVTITSTIYQYVTLTCYMYALHCQLRQLKIAAMTSTHNCTYTYVSLDLYHFNLNVFKNFKNLCTAI